MEIKELSEREQEVVALIGLGLPSKEIARKLDISPRTVEVHRAAALRKTKCRNTLQLALLANGVDVRGKA